MKGLLVFLTTIAVVAAAGGFEPGLRVKFGKRGNPGETHFFDIPKTKADAKAAGWKQTRRPAGPLPRLVLYCPSDKVLCVYYDDTDYIAGIQVALPKLEFSENVFDWAKRGFTSWNTAVDNVCQKFWTLQQYFVDEEFLKISKKKRLAARNSSRILQAGGVWLTGFDKQLSKISIQEKDIIHEQVFKEQACIPAMGLHYSYNMSESIECTDDQIYPWFLLTRNNELIATVFITFGQLELRKAERDWFERPDFAIAKAIVPRGSPCLYDLLAFPGVVSMHIYYIDKPWTITC